MNVPGISNQPCHEMFVVLFVAISSTTAEQRGDGGGILTEESDPPGFRIKTGCLASSTSATVFLCIVQRFLSHFCIE